MKNYFQRRIDSGQKDFEDVVADTEGKKSRGERTGPLPVPNFASKRRYEATPSSIILPRPLAPQTDAASETDETRPAPKGKHATPSSTSAQPVPLQARPPPEKERNVNRYPPLAQASSAPIPTGPVLAEDATRATRPQAPMPSRMPGPRMGYFPDDRREVPASVMSHTTSRPQEAPISARQAPVSAPEIARMESLHAQGYRSSNIDAHGSPLVTTQGAMPPSQPTYLPPQPQPSLVPTPSHSRQPSLTKPPSSPVQPLQRPEPEIHTVRHDPMSQRSYYSLPGQPVGMAQPPPVLSPPKETPRPSLPPSEPAEAPRQVPAKRSNIMSILNDEPEEPQPRKRFASDQASLNTAGRAASPSRPVYTGVQSMSQPPSAPRQEEPVLSTPQQAAPVYTQQSPYLPPARTYSDYQAYAPPPSNSTGPANNDWMARFDPRGQQSQQPPTSHQQVNNRPSSTLPPQQPFSPYASNQNVSAHALPNLTAPSPAPTPSPAPSHRPSYHASVYAPSPASHAQAVAASSRDMAAQNQMLRSTIGSPTSRNSNIAYGTRQGPPTPIQSPANLLGVASRQTPATASYASPAPPTPVPMTIPSQQHPSSHQTYQQHVQTMVSGAHQQQPHRSSLGYPGPQYGHSTPPPQAQAPRVSGLPGPPPQAMPMGRSYTPPAILQPNPSGGMSYAPGGPAQSVGAVHPLQARPGPGVLGDGGNPGHGHHRVYSQGSNAGSLPVPMTPQHQPR